MPFAKQKGKVTMRRPNILWICTDQQRWDTLGCCGNSFVRTPNVDWLAEKGLSYRAAPFILNWPGHVRAQRSGALVELMDLAQTVLDAAGLPITGEVTRSGAWGLFCLPSIGNAP